MSAAFDESTYSRDLPWQMAVRLALPLSTRAALAGLLARHRVLLVPGWNNSGPAHWQTLWQAAFPALERVEQREWARPGREDWVDTLDRSIRRERRPVILVAHSLGCVTVAHWAARELGQGRDAWPVAGALLVAPADVERPSANDALAPFSPIPRQPLPFASQVVGSSDDPCCSEERAREMAAGWGACFTCVRQAGHINADSGIGFWPQGLAMLAWLRRE